MAKCVMCKKKSIFLRVNARGLCQTCADALEKQQKTESKAMAIRYLDFKIPQETINLLWFVDGPNKNYSASRELADYGSFSISYPTNNEPSAISRDLEISLPSDTRPAIRPPYYPQYCELSPEQRWEYLKSLENIFNPSVDVGYIFLFYYGLERHLKCGKTDQAFETILKLRQVHKNNSFQNYSFTALFLTAIKQDKRDALLRLFTEDCQDGMSFNLFIKKKLLLEESFTAKEIMHWASYFEFDKTTYIKSYPDLFLKTLEWTLANEESEFNPKKYIKKSKLAMTCISMYANLSLREEYPIEDYSNQFLLKQQGYLLLTKTHELVKAELKSNRASYEKVEPKGKKEIFIYDESIPYASIGQYNEIKKIEKEIDSGRYVSPYNNSSSVDLHYEYLRITTEIYKERAHPLAQKHLIELFKADIDLIEKDPQMFSGLTNNPAYPSFLRLILLYQKSKQFEEAITICKIAIKHKIPHEHDFDYYSRKLVELEEKLRKSI